MTNNEQGLIRRLLFKIAHVVGRTIEELENTLSYEEFMEWHAYFTIEFEEQQKAHKQAERKNRNRRL